MVDRRCLRQGVIAVRGFHVCPRLGDGFVRWMAGGRCACDGRRRARARRGQGSVVRSLAMSPAARIGWGLAGVLVGWLALVLVRRVASQGSRLYWNLWALLLVSAALIYIGFAAVAQAAVGWLLLECLGLVAYGGVAAWGVRAWPGWIGLGWLAHMLWDAIPRAGHSDYAPTWYGPACMGYDLVVGLALLLPLLRQAVKKKAK